MTRRVQRGQLEALPRREELEALIRYYHHLQNEHKRAHLEGGVRRRIEDQLLEVRERFDRFLAEWVPEEDLRRAWWNHLHARAPEPPGPAAIRPLLFRGTSEAGSVVEVRGKKGEETEVLVDGTLVERIAVDGDLTFLVPPLDFGPNRRPVYETFSAPPEALEALADFLDDGGPPPWEHASELLADGLVDVHFGLTPRGRRALASREA